MKEKLGELVTFLIKGSCFFTLPLTGKFPCEFFTFFLLFSEENNVNVGSFGNGKPQDPLSRNPDFLLSRLKTSFISSFAILSPNHVADVSFDACYWTLRRLQTDEK